MPINIIYMKILLVGGAGYIGSHTIKLLLNSNHEIAVLDNLSTGHINAIQEQKFFNVSLSNKDELIKIFQNNSFDIVMHFASFINVEESFTNPKNYYENNIVNTLNLLDVMIQNKVQNFIFSSSASVYGEPKYIPIDEKHSRFPINPYGRTKFFLEEILKDYERAYNLKSISLRYFNACGADSNGSIGELHNPETHLIPLILQVASGRRDRIKIFGNDYETPDGTCHRDYVHVMDIAKAHILAAEDLKKNNISRFLNIGNNKSFSVLEIVKAVKKITKKDIKISFEPRRVGDPARLVADNSAIKSILEWETQYSNLDNILSSAWAWEQKISMNLKDSKY